MTKFLAILSAVLYLVLLGAALVTGEYVGFVFMLVILFLAAAMVAS